MGILDDMQSAMNRGAAAAGRTGRQAKLKMQLADLERQRTGLAAQLGASLYDVVRTDENLRAGRESLFDAIEQIDTQRASIEAEIAQIEQEAARAQLAAQGAAATGVSYVCPNCGAPVKLGNAFCGNCGTPLAQPEPEPVVPSATRTCVHCGAPINPGDLFCMNCGQRQDEAPSDDVADVVDVPDDTSSAAPADDVNPAFEDVDSTSA